MILNIYSIFDSKASAYVTPFFMGTDAVAIRACMDVLRDPAHQWNFHAGDFRLVCLGYFDDASGEIAPASGPRFVVEIATLVYAQSAKDEVQPPVSGFFNKE